MYSFSLLLARVGAGFYEINANLNSSWSCGWSWIWAWQQSPSVSHLIIMIRLLRFFEWQAGFLYSVGVPSGILSWILETILDMVFLMAGAPLYWVDRTKFLNHTLWFMNVCYLFSNWSTCTFKQDLLFFLPLVWTFDFIHIIFAAQ